MTVPSPRQVFRSAGFYPLTGLYLVGVAIIYLLTIGRLTVLYGLLVLSGFAMFAMLLAAWREIRTVHRLAAVTRSLAEETQVLVNGQRTELLARIDELVALLVSSGVGVPAGGPKEKTARDDATKDNR